MERYCNEYYSSEICKTKSEDEIYNLIILDLQNELDYFILKGKTSKDPGYNDIWNIFISKNFDIILAYLTDSYISPRMLEIDINQRTCTPKCSKFLSMGKVSNKDFSIIPIKLFWEGDPEAHATALLIDNKKKIIEYFDSTGSSIGIDIIKPYIDEEVWKIIDPSDFITIELMPQCQTEDPFCLFYSYLYMYLRDKYSALDINIIYYYLSRHYKLSDMKYMIRGFVYYVINIFLSLGIKYDEIKKYIIYDPNTKLYSYTAKLFVYTYETIVESDYYPNIEDILTIVKIRKYQPNFSYRDYNNIRDKINSFFRNIHVKSFYNIYDLSYNYKFSLELYKNKLYVINKEPKKILKLVADNLESNYLSKNYLDLKNNAINIINENDLKKNLSNIWSLRSRQDVIHNNIELNINEMNILPYIHIPGNLKEYLKYIKERTKLEKKISTYKLYKLYKILNKYKWDLFKEDNKYILYVYPNKDITEELYNVFDKNHIYINNYNEYYEIKDKNISELYEIDKYYYPTVILNDMTYFPVPPKGNIFTSLKIFILNQTVKDYYPSIEEKQKILDIKKYDPSFNYDKWKKDTLIKENVLSLMWDDDKNIWEDMLSYIINNDIMMHILYKYNKNICYIAFSNIDNVNMSYKMLSFFEQLNLPVKITISNEYPLKLKIQLPGSEISDKLLLIISYYRHIFYLNITYSYENIINDLNRYNLLYLQKAIETLDIPTNLKDYYSYIKDRYEIEKKLKESKEYKLYTILDKYSSVIENETLEIHNRLSDEIIEELEKEIIKIFNIEKFNINDFPIELPGKLKDIDKINDFYHPYLLTGIMNYYVEQ